MLLHLRKYIFIVFVVLLGGITASGQEFEAICRELFERALVELGQNCAGLGNNSVCYGFGTVSAEFVTLDGNPIAAEDISTFQAVGEQIPLYSAENNQILRAIETVAFNPVGDETELSPEVTPAIDELIVQPWGVAAIYTAANQPQQLEDAGARILLFGETHLTDNTAAENIFISSTLVNVSVTNAEIFTAPPEYTITSDVIDTVSGEFEADAISPDGEWVRVFYTYERRFSSRTTAWLPTESLLDEPDLSSLPLLGADYGAPMQNMLLEMSPNQAQCNEDKTSGLFIQGEDAIETDLSINNIPIRISSVIFVELIAPNVLRITVLDGIVELFPETEDSVVLVTGFSVEVTFEVTEDGEVIFEVSEPLLENNFVLNEYDGITDNAPDNIIDPVPESVVITASGNGNPINVVVLRDEEENARINQYCLTGALPDYICVRFNP